MIDYHDFYTFIKLYFWINLDFKSFEKKIKIYCIARHQPKPIYNRYKIEYIIEYIYKNRSMLHDLG